MAFNLQNMVEEYDETLSEIIHLSTVRPLNLVEWNYVLDEVKQARDEGVDHLGWFFPVTDAGDIPVFSTGLYRVETRSVRDHYPWTPVHGPYGGGFTIPSIQHPQEDDPVGMHALRGTYADLPLHGQFLRRQVGWRSTETDGAKPGDVLVHYLMVDEPL